MGTFIFIVAVVLAIGFAFTRSRKSPLAREISEREIQDADAIRAGRADRVALDPRTTRDVLRALGAALEVDPGRLRLDDPLHLLWDLNPHAGFHQRATFETWLVAHYPRLPDGFEPLTIAQLVAALQKLPLRS